jgi:hypothetical protein
MIPTVKAGPWSEHEITVPPMTRQGDDDFFKDDYGPTHSFIDGNITDFEDYEVQLSSWERFDCAYSAECFDGLCE